MRRKRERVCVSVCVWVRIRESERERGVKEYDRERDVIAKLQFGLLLKDLWPNSQGCLQISSLIRTVLCLSSLKNWTVVSPLCNDSLETVSS